jgi:hypothetical protein
MDWLVALDEHDAWTITVRDLELEAAHRHWEIPDVYFDADERRRREAADDHYYEPEDEDDGADQ